MLVPGPQSSIKSVQFFTVSSTSNAGTSSQTISSVNPNKTVVYLSGSVALAASTSFDFKITSPTNLDVISNNGGGVRTFYLQLIEYV